MERVRGVEPLSTGWKPVVMPLYHTRFCMCPRESGLRPKIWGFVGLLFVTPAPPETNREESNLHYELRPALCFLYPQQESNPHHELRKLAFYPLNYGGMCGIAVFTSGLASEE